MLFALALLLGADPVTYARPELLAEATALPAGTRVLDVRGRNLFLKGHAPGAVWVDVLSWDKVFRAAPVDAAGWSNRFGALGITPVNRIVVVGGDDVRDAARVWWILRYWGFDQAQLLNGGWSAWTAAGSPVTTEAEAIKPTKPALVAQSARLTTKEKLLGALPKKPQILDARTNDEYCGKAETATRNGAVPGAIHLEWTDCLDAKTHRFKTAAELNTLLAERGIDVTKPAITYCQSGGRASVVAFTLELMGGMGVSNYYRSWSEWGNDKDTPVEKRNP